MLNFSHSLVVGTFLFLLVPSVALGQRGALITWHERVEYPYIKKCALSVITPEVVRCNIEPGTILLVRSTMYQVFIGDRLQRRLCTNIVANFAH